jgi:GDP-4-dehydro-6-deoxy-D-mannose reductase
MKPSMVRESGRYKQMSRAFITGASGFVGPYLIRYLLKERYEVTGGVHNSQARLPKDCRQVRLDVTNQQQLKRAIAEVQPHEVYHLAGRTRPASGQIEEFYRVNFGGTLNLLEAVRQQVPEAKVLLVGSGYAYGRVDHPITERELLEPVDHYGVSKASADLLGGSYALGGLQVVRVRPFSHSGPGQSPDFLLPTLVQQFAQIRAGKREPIIYLGNLNSVRDFSDVRDIVRGYHLTLQKGRSGETYNLGSGRGVSVQKLFELVHREFRKEVELRVQPSRVRLTDIPYLVADVSRAYRELGWEATIPVERTIRDMLKND